LQAIFLGQSLSSFNRQRLIAYKVPFIIPDNQMYLPDLAIDLKEHFVKARSKIKSLGPAAQVVVLYLLLNPDVDAVTPKELADRLDYSTMTMSRAVDEIEAAGLADVFLDGKRRVAQFDKNRRQLWETALPYLKTPVIKRLWADRSAKIDLLTAGESALAKYSMLTPPKRPTYAISSKGWKLLKAEISVEGSLYIEEAQFQLEIWRYEPQILAEQETVDPFSLYLSLKETQDERIEAALAEMMEKKVQW
jgi:DNA-binding MarR family transcriptional regulator